MKGRVHFFTRETDAEDKTNAEVEVEAGPLSDEHFRAIIGLVRLAIIVAGAVAVVALEGGRGLLLDGAALVVYALVQLVRLAD